MKRVAVGLLLCLIGAAALAQFSFHLIENFESGSLRDLSHWWVFGSISRDLVKNKPGKGYDLIADSCGQYALRLSGKSKDWYVGGIGSDLGIDASNLTRFQVDIYGNDDEGGKLLVEFFDDDNNNYIIEQDAKKDYRPIYDDKWAVEISISGKGFTRVSIPFTAFKDANPGVGNDRWDPVEGKGSGGLLKMQLVLISAQKSGSVDVTIDNLLLTH